ARLSPFSYFWTCWKLTPSLSPSSACEIRCSTRRRRIRFPSSMSGLPALRCFIFFAADLFILVSPSFRRKAPEQMGQGFTLIYLFQFAWMDEFVLKPREFCGIECFYQPVDHVPHPRDPAATAMIGQPNIEWPAQFNLQRYYLPSKRTGICRKHADPGAVGDGPVAGAGAAHIGPRHQQAPLGNTGKPALESPFGCGLVSDLHHEPVLDQFVRSPRGAVSLDVFLAGEHHQMHSAEPDEFDVKRGRSRQMDRNVGLMPRHVGGTHRTVEIDENIRERLLKLDEARDQPKCSQTFGNGDPDFARECVGGGVARAQQVE